MTDEQARDEVNRRLQVWGWQAAPRRKYTFLVAGYFHSRGPLLVDAEEKYLRFFNDEGLGLLELVEASADRPLTASERLDAIRRATAAEGVSQLKQSRYAVSNLFHSNPGAGYLRHALDDPQQAARQLLADGCQGIIKFSCLDFRRVMECLCPATWRPSRGWSPPADAVRWARRIYESRNFADLPVLADLLEDGGCPDRFLLDHCRHYPEHFRGCAALDRLLGR